MRDWILGVGLLLGCFAGVLAALFALRRRCLPHPELLRKLLHLAMGLVCLALPWLFSSPGPVLVLGAVFLFLLLLLRTWPPLRDPLGGLIHDVNRSSLGDICFVLGVVSLFVFSSGDPLYFCVPLLVLALADSAASLVGRRYGSERALPGPPAKTLEGSVAFLLVSFLTTHVALLLFSGVGRVESLLAAATLALVLTLVEAISGRGLDNLFIPLAALVLLRAYVPAATPTLIAHLGSAALSLLLVRKAQTLVALRPSTALRLVVAAYVLWAAFGAGQLLPHLALTLPPADELARTAAPVIFTLFAIGAVLIQVGNRLRAVPRPQARALWVKYFTYGGIVVGMVFCASRHTLLHIVLVAIGALCVWEVLHLRAYWAAVWVAASVWFALHVPDFLTMYLVVAASDGFAQVGGRLLGGPRLWPRLSPGKTLSGTLCGIATAVCIGSLFGLQPLMAGLLALAGLAGDLTASAIKRAAGVKDFSHALPGHGGFMDRFDSLWGAAPIGVLLW